MKKCKSCSTELPFTINNGIRSYKHKYGYGIDCKCLAKWTIETKEGKEWREKQTAYKMKKNQKEKRVAQKKIDRKMKIQLMSTSEYWSNVFEPKIREVIRVIDKGNGCIVKNSTLGKLAAGHYYSVGSNKTLSINCHNIFLQSFQSNGWRGGEPIQYMEGLVRVFGQDYANFVSELKKCPALNLTKIELMERYDILLNIILKYKKEGFECLTPFQRIEKRNEVNKLINLYPNDFLIYNCS